MNSCDEPKVFPYIHIVIKSIEFGQIANALFHLQRGFGHIQPAYSRRSRSGRQVAGQDLHRGRLAGAIGPQETHDLALTDRERDIVHGFLIAVLFQQIFYLDGHGYWCVGTKLLDLALDDSFILLKSGLLPSDSIIFTTSKFDNSMGAIIGTDWKEAARRLKGGEVVAIPTETVYGLAADIRCPDALQQIYRIKGRPQHNPLIVHCGSLEQAAHWVRSFPQSARKLADRFWPGPLTLVLPRTEEVNDIVTAGQDTLAIRVPDHPLTLTLLRESGLALAAPSANPSNYISPVTAQQVERLLGGKIGYILDGGRCTAGIESTIVSFEGEQPRLLRPGPISPEAIEAVTGLAVLEKGTEGPAHPGMFKKHYSPRTPLLLVDDVKAAVLQDPTVRPGLLLYRDRSDLVPDADQVVLSAGGNPEEAARNLYDALHRLDAGGYSLIIAEKIPGEGIARAVNDRLIKAAGIYE